MGMAFTFAGSDWFFPESKYASIVCFRAVKNHPALRARESILSRLILRLNPVKLACHAVIFQPAWSSRRWRSVT